MLLLRVGRKARWGEDRRADNPGHVVDAARDVSLSGGEIGLSVYRVEGDDDARELAVRYALTCRKGPADHMDYVVFPDELATSIGLLVRELPSRGLDPLLNARHHEILGLTPELQLRLAAAILASGESRVTRIERGDLPSLGAELRHRDPELKNYLKGVWATLLDDSATGG
jgi:hypothetical protein